MTSRPDVIRRAPDALAEPDWARFCDPEAPQAPLVYRACGPVTVAQRARQPVYLATPYSLEVTGPDGRWQMDRSHRMVVLAAMEAARLARVGVTAISPIVLSGDMCHVDTGLDPLGAGFWHRWCAPVLNACGAVVIPEIPGWWRSRGVWREACFALGAMMPVFIYGPVPEAGLQNRAGPPAGDAAAAISGE